MSTNSLADVHATVDTTRAGGSKWRKLAAFFGPAYLVSVGYMDPGNWATDLAGGAQFGYRLIWVLVMSNVMALLLQSLSARLGIVQGRDLAQCNRLVYSKPVNFILYILAELAIAACDLAEVLGMAVGLNLLLGVPLMWGVLITLLDTFLLLYLQRLGIRKMEAFIIALVVIIGVSFGIELFLAKPELGEIVKGLKPSIPNKAALYIAIGIIGATVMPHNLYLHSALVQTRKLKRDDASIRKAIKFNTWDSAIALNAALFVNAAILILAARVFHSSGHSDVAELKDAHKLLYGLLGTKWASHLFAIALIAAGQSSTITGTLAGQIVMEGYLSLRINPWMRRLLTRTLAIVPAVIVIGIMGEGSVDKMLIFSQVLLSMQLAFAVIPLIHFVSDRKEMGTFRIGAVGQFFAWLVAAVIVALNLQLLWTTGQDFCTAHPQWYWVGLMLLLGAGILLLLIITIIAPLRKRRLAVSIGVHRHPVLDVSASARAAAGFSTIAVALDYSARDVLVIRYALQLAAAGAKIVLIHIVESASAGRMGANTEDYETKRDRAQLEEFAAALRAKGYEAIPVLGFRQRSREIARIVDEQGALLLILGSHGHRGVSDAIFGETINTVRHMVKVPVFIAQ